MVNMVNVALLKNPINWATVISMIGFGIIAVALIQSGLSGTGFDIFGGSNQ